MKMMIYAERCPHIIGPIIQRYQKTSVFAHGSPRRTNIIACEFLYQLYTCVDRLILTYTSQKTFPVLISFRIRRSTVRIVGAYMDARLFYHLSECNGLVCWGC